MSSLPFLLPLAELPVPRDLSLPLPIPAEVLRVLAVLLFLLHIFFVNLTVGGSLLTVILEIVGLRHPRYDTLARRIAETVTVNKSLAVVLGIGPLLVLNLLYTTHIYSANALTGHAWALIIPLVTAAFLLAYLHKYTWDAWTGPKKLRHLLTGTATALLFLIIPLIFLTNVNLMILPEKWSEVTGFFSSLRLGNVFPRYFHFLAASLALCGLFLAQWFGRACFPVATELPDFTHAALRRHFYRWTFFVSLAQFAFGPLLLLTLPTAGITGGMLTLILGGAVIAALTLHVLWREIRSPDAVIGRRYWLIAGLFSIVILAMGQGRHLHREATLAPHRALIAERTTKFAAIEQEVQDRLKAGLDAGASLAPPNGRKLFMQTCAACHAVSKPTAAPALVEIYSLYKDNPAGIVAWAKAPGKKRAQYGQMPSMAHLGDDALSLVAAHMLEQGKAASASDNTPPGAAK